MHSQLHDIGVVSRGSPPGHYEIQRSGIRYSALSLAATRTIASTFKGSNPLSASKRAITRGRRSKVMSQVIPPGGWANPFGLAL
jgi:hypothetical protein